MGTISFWDKLTGFIRHPLAVISGKITERFLRRNNMVMVEWDRWQRIQTHIPSTERAS